MLKGKNVNAKVVKNVTKNKNMVKNLEREEGDLPPSRSWSGKDVKSFFKPRNKAKVRNYKPMKVIYAETGNMKDSEREEILKQKGIFNVAYDSNLSLRKKLKTRTENKDMDTEQTEDQTELGEDHGERRGERDLELPRTRRQSLPVPGEYRTPEAEAQGNEEDRERNDGRILEALQQL